MIKGIIFGITIILAFLSGGAVVWKKIFGQKKSGQKKLHTEKSQTRISQNKKTQNSINQSSISQNSISQDRAGALQEERRKKQIDRLVSLRAEADNAEAEIVYSQLFDKIGGALQKLFALAEESGVREHYERLLEDEIQFPIERAFQTFRITCTDNGFSLPMKKAGAEPGLRERLLELSERDLDNAIRECEGRIGRAGRYGIPKGAITRGAGSLCNLVETPAAELDWQKMKALAKEIEKAFIESGIYPLFRRDEKVLERPDLCAQFIEVQGKALIWPGLFIVIDNKLQLYGNFQGTCHRGEW